MKAFIYQSGNLKVGTKESPKVQKSDVLIKLKRAGLNRRDLNIPNRAGINDAPLILGSDGAGIISNVGESVTRFKVGDEVIINPALRWERNSAAPPKEFDILGMPDDGTFAEEIVISEEQVELKPENLTWDEAGVLALSGLTGFRAMFTQGKLTKGQTVFIPGAGSGVATYLISYANAIGARVIVSSRSKEKREAALKLGADIAIDTHTDWTESLENEKIDLVIDSVGNATFNKSLSVLKLGGRIVVFGATAGDEVNLNLRYFFYGQYQLIGSTMGSREELREMLEFIKKHGIKPIIDSVYLLENAEQAFDYLEKNDQFGKIVLKNE